MKITLLQTDIVWASPQENIERVEKLMQQSGVADLYVLPEMWATGFATEPEGIAEDEQASIALKWMKQTAQQKNCALSGSLAISTPATGGDGSGLTYRNRHYFVTPQGVTFYDKHHLFTYGHEDEHFTAGQEAVVVEWQGWRLLLQTCYDLRFPCFSRYGRSFGERFLVKGEGKIHSPAELSSTHPSPLTTHHSPLIYDAIIYVANWPEKRQLAWDTLVRARAIENQCYVVAVNRTGEASPSPSKGGEPSSTSGKSGEVYAGGSVIIDPVGRTIAECPAGEHSATAEIVIEKLRDMRSRFRVLDDRD